MSNWFIIQIIWIWYYYVNTTNEIKRCTLLKPKISLIIITLLMMGGCNTLSQKDISEIDPAELPDVVAFQDEFTREFMASTEEVEEGYYLFKSKTGGYTMMFPENAQMDEIFYEMPGESFEAIQFSESEETNEFEYYVRAFYNSKSRAKSAENLKDVLSSHLEYEGSYEPIEYKDKTIYFATTKYVTRSGNRITYRFFAVIKSNDNDQAVSMVYNVVTYKNNDKINIESIKEKVLIMMESIKFHSGETDKTNAINAKIEKLESTAIYPHGIITNQHL